MSMTLSTEKATHAAGIKLQCIRIVRNRPLFIGSIFFIIFVLCAVFGPLLYGRDPLLVDTANRIQGPSSLHPFGTDTFGRDVLARILKGAQTSLIIGFLTAACSCVLGTAIGLISAFVKSVSAVMMRLMDGVMAFPAVLLAIAISSSFGASKQNVIISLSVVFMPVVARVVRSAALNVKEQTFIEALRVQGASFSRILLHNVLPNVISPLVVQVTFIFADALLIEAALSFIGAGVSPPEPSWGNMLLEGKSVVYTAWWLVAFPGVAIMSTILFVNLMGDGLRDYFDPHQKFIKRVGLCSRIMNWKGGKKHG
jgi:peptide/nickel transport system permease protein